MNKTKNIIWFLSVLTLCGLSIWLSFLSKKNKQQDVQIPQQQTVYAQPKIYLTGFSDGLTKPDSVTKYETDEFGEGVSEKSVYYVDINDDGASDRITRTLFSNTNAHSYYEYKIELNRDGKYVDITPKNLSTVNGADCDLQQIQFAFKPQFKITMIYREMGDTWDQATMAHKKTFKLSGNGIKTLSDEEMQPVCDVKELF